MRHLSRGLAARVLLLACMLLGAAAPAAAQVFTNGPISVKQYGDWTFGFSGPIPTGSNTIGGVTQSGAWTVGLTGAIPAGSNAIGSVLADLRVAGSPVAAGNPVPIAGSVSVSNFPAIQAVTISGTLPAFAATPTFNVGTTNGIALDATLTARLGTLGQKPMSGSAPVAIASDQSPVPIQGGNSTAVKTDGSATTQPVSSTTLATAANQATANSSLSTIASNTTGAATAANQVTANASLVTIAQRAVTYLDSAGGGTTANVAFSGTIHDVGATSPYASVNAAVFTTQSSTFSIQGCVDSACSAQTFTLAPQTVTMSNGASGAYGSTKAPVVTRFWRAQFVSGANGNINLATSATAN